MLRKAVLMGGLFAVTAAAGYVQQAEANPCGEPYYDCCGYGQLGRVYPYFNGSRCEYSDVVCYLDACF